MSGLMNYCENCNVFVDKCLRYCPLCTKELTLEPSAETMYPQITEKKYLNRKDVVTELLMIVTCIVIAICVFINIVTYNGVAWFLAVAAPIIYAWVLVKNTIVSDMYVGAKVLFQILALSGLFIAVDYAGGRLGWSFEFFVPVIIIIGIIYMDVYAYIYKSYWRENLIYAIILVFLGSIPIVLYFTGITHLLIPTFLAMVAVALTVLGILRFTLRYIKTEVKKRFHM